MDGGKGKSGPGEVMHVTKEGERSGTGKSSQGLERKKCVFLRA